MPFQIDDFWREHIGKIDTDHITNSTLFILAQSDNPASTSRVLLDKVNTLHFALLEEIYELRCAVEHLNPMSDKLSAYPSGAHDNLKRVRAYQAELLASFVYRKILANPDILPTFRDEQTKVCLPTHRGRCRGSD